MLQFIVVSFITLYCLPVIAENEVKDVTVFLKANGTVDVDAIKKMSHTHSVYEVKPFQVPKGNQWNYAVLANGFTSEKAMDAYVSAIQDLSSVENTKALDMKPESSLVLMGINGLLKVAKVIGKLFGYLPSRPLKPQVPPYVKCETVDIEMSEPMFVFAYMHVRDEAAMKKYSWLVMTRLLPVLDMEFLYQGIPLSKRWSFFNLQKYDGKKTFCEYVESELVIKYGELYMKGFDEQQTYTAKKI